MSDTATLDTAPPTPEWVPGAPTPHPDAPTDVTDPGGTFTVGGGAESLPFGLETGRVPQYFALAEQGQELQQQWAAFVRATLDDPDLVADAKRRRLEERAAEVAEELDALAERWDAAEREERSRLRRRAFAPPVPVGATPEAVAALRMSARDAFGRAMGAAADVAATWDVATLTGDDQLARAVLARVVLGQDVPASVADRVRAEAATEFPDLARAAQELAWHEDRAARSRHPLAGVRTLALRRPTVPRVR